MKPPNYLLEPGTPCIIRSPHSKKFNGKTGVVKRNVGRGCYRIPSYWYTVVEFCGPSLPTTLQFNSENVFSLENDPMKSQEEIDMHQPKGVRKRGIGVVVYTDNPEDLDKEIIWELGGNSLELEGIVPLDDLGVPVIDEFIDYLDTTEVAEGNHYVVTAARVFKLKPKITLE